MNVSSQLLGYNALALEICLTITCGILQPTGVVTMTVKVLYNNYNMCTHDLSDMYAYICPWPQGRAENIAT